jgi:hypothetical protein
VANGIPKQIAETINATVRYVTVIMFFFFSWLNIKTPMQHNTMLKTISQIQGVVGVFLRNTYPKTGVAIPIKAIIPKLK